MTTQIRMPFNWLLCLAGCAFFLTLPISAEPKYNTGTPLLLRPFGDSITYGWGDWSGGGYCPTLAPSQGCAPAQKTGGGYRAFLSGNAIGSGQSFFRTEGSRLGNSNQLQWLTASNSHDGYPGLRTDQLEPVSKLLSFANATLVHIGTNDFAQSKSPETTFNNLVTLVENLLKANQGGQIIVAKIIPVTDAAGALLQSSEFTKAFQCPPTTPAKVNAAIASYNQQIEADLIARIKQSQPAHAARLSIVDMSSLLSAAKDYSDGIHPNIRGYCKMSLQWLNSVYTGPAAPPELFAMCDELPVSALQAMQQGQQPPPGGNGPPPGSGDYTPPTGPLPFPSEAFMKLIGPPTVPNPGRVRERVRQR